MPSTSASMRALSSPATMALTEVARRLAASGRPVISLASGDPDLATAPHIVEAAVHALESGATHYAPSRGTPDLLDAIVAKLQTENGVRVGPQQVLVAPGAKSALFAAIRAILDPGDDVLVLDPSWVSYAPLVVLAGGRPVPISLEASRGYLIDEAVIQESLTHRTKAIILNSPCNPTGRVATATELNSIARIAIENDLFVISDEIYEHFVFDGHRHRSIAADPEMASRTLIVNGFSKSYAMTGWRLGWLAAPTGVIELASLAHAQTVTAAATFTMAAGVAALKGPQKSVIDATALYRRRRDRVLEIWAGRPRVACPPSEGTFYLFPEIPSTNLTSHAVARTLLEDYGIACVPGSAFGSAGEGHLRLSLTAPDEELVVAARAVAAAFAKISADEGQL